MKIKDRSIALGLVAIAFFGLSVAGALQQGKASVQLHVHRFTIPGYPAMARQARVQGDVSALVHVNGNGKVEELSDFEGPALLQGALDSLKEWEFILPEEKPTTIRITFRFVLSGPERKENVVMNIRGSLPALVEIVTNPTSEKPGPDVVPDRRPHKP